MHSNSSVIQLLLYDVITSLWITAGSSQVLCMKSPFKLLQSLHSNSLLVLLYHAWLIHLLISPKWARGGTDLKRGYGDVQPWRPPFHASLVVCKGPISSKRAEKSVHKTSFWEKFGNSSLCSLNFCQTFSSRAPNLSSQDPSFRGKSQFASPHFGNTSCIPLPEQKLCVPLPGKEPYKIDKNKLPFHADPRCIKYSHQTEHSF